MTWIVFKPGNGINVTSHHIKGGRKYEHHLCYHCISLAPGPHGKSDSEWISSLSSLTILMEENQFFDKLRSWNTTLFTNCDFRAIWHFPQISTHGSNPKKN